MCGPSGLWQVEHPLSQTVGGPETLGTEDSGGPARDGLPTRKGSRAGWALEGITAATRGGAETQATERAASDRIQEAEPTDAEGTSGTEGEGSTTVETGRDNTDTDTTSDGSSLVVANTSVTTPAIGTATNPRTSAALPAALQRVARAHSPRKIARACVCDLLLGNYTRGRLFSPSVIDILIPVGSTRGRSFARSSVPERFFLSVSSRVCARTLRINALGLK
ncbi:hypothetical protein NDU88_002817 [Pleurodeles waltl]|uniref:Uncharacterized protein n=1 Tax=Pleurodeles waltl TaxID=8319 RepID=A0AAV7NES0_PLEWA|nr:hypothetical protein NDU88_002817 [Pleurodeles waltl]